MTVEIIRTSKGNYVIAFQSGRQMRTFYPTRKAARIAARALGYEIER